MNAFEVIFCAIFVILFMLICILFEVFLIKDDIEERKKLKSEKSSKDKKKK